MTSNSLLLIAACLALVLLTATVGGVMLFTRVSEMRRKRIHPQSASNSALMAAKLENIQPADNFRNLFEVPVLFYALAAVAVAIHQVPTWLVACAWVYVALRALHSFIHCSYNKVYHRLAVFLASFALLVGMWVCFFVSIASANAV
ncbi:MAPEG family protein [Paucibacter sp. AS339]|uniref:MAPEG family protein n=1 Tax=Paucibacter hankyongi TaxID=3133434 RepID=UPI0030AFF479